MCPPHLLDRGADVVCSITCAMPARRPGVCEQKSASQRLWARRPAQRRSTSPWSADGGWNVSDDFGKKGGMVFG
jgi:hypothetical protein